MREEKDEEMRGKQRHAELAAKLFSIELMDLKIHTVQHGNNPLSSAGIKSCSSFLYPSFSIVVVAPWAMKTPS
jgi:hypothetical protein